MKTLLTLFVLFLSLISLNSNAGIFDKTVCLETDVQIRLGNIYLPNKNKPFTGNILCEYENGKTKIKGEVKDGKIDGELFMWYENGQKKVEATFEGSGEYVAFLPSERGAVLAWDVHGNFQSKGEFVISCYNFINKYSFENNWISWIDIFDGDKLLTEGTVFYHKNGKLMSEDWEVAGRDWIDIGYHENGGKSLQTEWSYTSEYPKGIALVQGWYENGQKEFEGSMLHGYLPVGIHTEWHNNGQKKSELELSDDGMYDGLLIEWNENGQKVLEQEYIADELWGERTWFDNGQQKSITQYTYNLKDGVEINFFENGQKKSEIGYRENQKDGFEMIWNIDGELIKETYPE
ncbi:MAG: hypothetical protein ACJ0RE_05155 [Alphaproteobacteria bacterium]